MDFGYPPEQEALRREVRAFIAEHVTPEVMAEMEGHNEGLLGVTLGTCRGPAVRELFRKIHERGWRGISYPKEYGGQGGDRLSQYIVEEEFARANVAVGLTGTGAPAVMAAGTEEQKRYYVPRLISGEFTFAQGYTEPRGGADLASLQCRAVRDGDDYVINGQKMYTSGAHYFTHLYLMARTDPDAPKHKGISVFVFPMETPGITVRPLWTIQNDPKAPTRTTYGQSRTNETFFDDVRVPKTALLGKENEGWAVGTLDRGAGMPAHDDAQHVGRRARRPVYLRGLGREGVGARARGEDIRGDHPDARPVWAVAERLAARHRKRHFCAQPDGLLSVRDQPRRHASHAGSGRPPRPRHAAWKERLISVCANVT